jgi:hypothetical protein
MGFEFEMEDFELDEFEPVEMISFDDGFTEIMQKMIEEPQKVQPVRMVTPDHCMLLSEFFMTLEMDENDTIYLQLEGFSSPDYVKSINEAIADRPGWSIVQPGIFRLKVID